MNKNKIAAIVIFLISMQVAYGFYKIETKRTIELTSKNLHLDCLKQGGKSYLYFRSKDTEYRSNRLRLDCSSAVARIGDDWAIGVKESTSIVVYIKSGGEYFEGSQEESTFRLWKVLFPTIGVILSAFTFIFGDKKHKKAI